MFLVRAFHHGAILVNTKAGISTPKDLEGKRVGVNRGYTVTTGVWARGVLQQEYGVDLNKITWVLSGDEHVAEYRPPRTWCRSRRARRWPTCLSPANWSRAIGVDVDHPGRQALDRQCAGSGARRRCATRGHYPINHTHRRSRTICSRRDPGARGRRVRGLRRIEAHVSRAPESRADREADGGGQGAPDG